MDLISSIGLSSASGLNAYIPMLILGLMDRYTSLVELPAGWDWVSNGWVLTGVAVLLVVEFFADKIPVLDTVNDTVQSLVRPASGGIVFSSALAGDQMFNPNSAAFTWGPFIAGAVIALAFHLAKMFTRPVANASTAGLAAPVMSATGDVTSFFLAFTALLIPVLALLAILLVLAAFAYLIWRVLKRRKSAPIS
ncbi:MAG: DUF4126 domain-containing protein [Actinomycetaceae bacterium]|nr:DUF4126 domain-containing protein [Actinomycetaceae bacterium]